MTPQKQNPKTKETQKYKIRRLDLSRKKKDKNKIVGISSFNKSNCLEINRRTGYNGSIEFTNDILMIYTDGKYRCFPKKVIVKVLKEILKRFEEIR